MKLLSVEPTPSPNNMKFNLDETLAKGHERTYTPKDKEQAPSFIAHILRLDGIRNVYHAADFIAVERHPKKDWKALVPEILAVFGETTDSFASMQFSDTADADGFGEIHVYLQMFREIPMQIKLTTATEEVRVGLPDRFMNAVMEAQKAAENLILERKWVEQDVRYGEMDEVGEQVAAEVSAAYDQERLNRLVRQALSKEKPTSEREPTASPVSPQALDDPDWKKRYAAMERIPLTKSEIPVLAKALRDDHVSVRRLATAYLGEIGEPDVLPYLYEALKDPSPAVRRTAGDCLSDLGHPDAIDPMTEALQDENKLVRWRAARFLYEVGDKSALPALRKAQNDPEFEVSLQVKMAIERIEKEKEAKGTVWQQMTRR